MTPGASNAFNCVFERIHCCMIVECSILISGFGFSGRPATVLEANFLGASYTHANKTDSSLAINKEGFTPDQE